ncbi:hypothetical protein CYMTET_36575 [Cymbomonas tetramitiformis]|uniref:Uncharacterized protein n=1 Tax=Cymbomonas tetramitiformis TaxID=36881 RepID=A0AAE0CI22_9CHLO|nr:hypothetical protein CYMTET_36575 [Cymbomonas tetramitiformis]
MAAVSKIGVSGTLVPTAKKVQSIAILAATDHATTAPVSVPLAVVRKAFPNSPTLCALVKTLALRGALRDFRSVLQSPSRTYLDGVAEGTRCNASVFMSKVGPPLSDAHSSRRKVETNTPSLKTVVVKVHRAKRTQISRRQRRGPKKRHLW